MIFENRIISIYRQIAYTRQDGNGTAYYFSAEDFDGLSKTPYSFKSSKGHNLQGYFYSYDNPIDKRIVIFDHGFGGGHRSYMKEIEKLCSHGYLVFAYDHTGCMESGGSDTNGMAQSLCDLNDCINTLKNDESFSDFDISVVGHSWGGFSTLNITAFHPDVSHVVAISGFVSVELLVKSNFGGILKLYRKAIMRLESKSNPCYARCSAIESLSNTDVKALLIYSDNDPLCSKVAHYDALAAGLKNCDNVKLLLVSNKGHNPNYTADAVKYLGEYLGQSKKMKKKLKTDEQKAAFVSSWDWNRMTAQDDSVWNEIFDCLDS